jgi:hypothetical protein
MFPQRPLEKRATGIAAAMPGSSTTRRKAFQGPQSPECADPGNSHFAERMQDQLTNNAANSPTITRGGREKPRSGAGQDHAMVLRADCLVICTVVTSVHPLSSIGTAGTHGWLVIGAGVRFQEHVATLAAVLALGAYGAALAQGGGGGGWRRRRRRRWSRRRRRRWCGRGWSRVQRRGLEPERARAVAVQVRPELDHPHPQARQATANAAPGPPARESATPVPAILIGLAHVKAAGIHASKMSTTRLARKSGSCPQCCAHAWGANRRGRLRWS